VRRRVVAFAAHPDDLEVHMGAALIALAEAGAELICVHATRGERGTLQPSDGTRVDEAERALGGLGARLEWLGLPDAGLAGEARLAVRLEEQLRRELGEGEGEPLLLFGPGPQDPHADHAALARALIQVVGELGASRGQNIPLWHWLDCQGQPPSHALALDWGYERKEALIRAHASQLPGEKGPRGHLPGGLDIVERARQRDLALGAHLGCAWAEPFVRTGAQIAARPQRLACVEGFDTA
jgi:LmbE family N-acetylglucosaminyl deacetylase